MAVTCEDRRVVRKCCIRVLLVRRIDLEPPWRLGIGAAGTSWSSRGTTTGEASRSTSLFSRYQEEQKQQREASANDIQGNLLPLVDRQAHHPRIRMLSLGLNVEEPIIRPPLQVDWERYLPQIAELGLRLPDTPVVVAAK